MRALALCASLFLLLATGCALSRQGQAPEAAVLKAAEPCRVPFESYEAYLAFLLEKPPGDARDEQPTEAQLREAYPRQAFEALAARDGRCLRLPGTGERPDDALDELGGAENRAVDARTAEALALPEVDPRQRVVFGVSRGAVNAFQLARRFAAWHGSLQVYADGHSLWAHRAEARTRIDRFFRRALLPPVSLNHLYVVLDAETFGALATSRFWHERFAGVDGGLPDFAPASAGTKTLYVRGRDTYLEWMSPENTFGEPLGKVGLGFGVEQPGALARVFASLGSCAGTSSRPGCAAGSCSRTSSGSPSAWRPRRPRPSPRPCRHSASPPCKPHRSGSASRAPRSPSP